MGCDVGLTFKISAQCHSRTKVLQAEVELVQSVNTTKRGDFPELTEADWEYGFALKFFSIVRCTRAAWPHLRARSGSVVNIAGIDGRTGSAEFAIGGSVNTAILNLTKALADRGIKDGVRVIAITRWRADKDTIAGLPE